MPVRFSIHAPAAERHCGRSRAIVAFSVPMARFRARRSRPSVWVRGAPLPAVAGSHYGKQYRQQLTRLAAKHAYERTCAADYSRRVGCRPTGCCAGSNGHLDRRPRLNGRGMHPRCAVLRTDALPVHWAVLSRYDCSGARARAGYRSGWPIRMADPSDEVLRRFHIVVPSLRPQTSSKRVERLWRSTLKRGDLTKPRAFPG
jgi:hypothetical protein